ncbi:ice-binding family protein [Nocardioides sp. T2.26MG-1]|uniref:ice-binding family protein n=1 Tax=Nocardioides sp. T2.26MG-1 TaxID=3041166 RepID=UPI00406CE1B2
MLAGTTVTNTGPSVISGDVGVSPGAAVTGFPPGQVNAGHVRRGVRRGPGRLPGQRRGQRPPGLPDGVIGRGSDAPRHPRDRARTRHRRSPDRGPGSADRPVTGRLVGWLCTPSCTRSSRPSPRRSGGRG